MDKIGRLFKLEKCWLRRPLLLAREKEFFFGFFSYLTTINGIQF